jgi:hypothetical protein
MDDGLMWTGRRGGHGWGPGREVPAARPTCQFALFRRTRGR